MRRAATLFDEIEPPWFEMSWIGNGHYCTTDAYFAQKVRERGVPIYVDHNLSKRIEHVGHHAYHCAEVAAWKRAQQSKEQPNGQ